MKQISQELQTHLQQDVTTLTTCWKLKRMDGTVLGFTNHNSALTLDGITYEAQSGFTPTAIESSSTLNIDNLDVEALLDSEAITRTDIMAGLYDFAEIEMFEVNYADLSQGILPLRFGWLGEIKMQGTQFIAEIRGLTQKLTHTIGATYSPSCRASLGDSRCGVNVDTFSATGALTSVTSASVIGDAAQQALENSFNFGIIHFTTGANAGISGEIKQLQTNGMFTLMLPLPYLPHIGDKYRITQGCDKQFSTCKHRFNNAINFRGEPHVPGLDKILETAATRSL